MAMYLRPCVDVGRPIVSRTCDGAHGKIGFKAEPTEITVLE